MNTLYSLGELNTPLGLVMALAIGYFFGACLERAGFGSSRKLTGIFYLRDMAVLKVMFTAVVTALVGHRYLLALGWLEQDSLYMLDTYWGAQIAGGLVFGVGFVVGGWCPGTAIVGLASAKWDALVFLGGAVVGSILFSELFEFVQPLQQGFHAGTLFLPETLGISWRVFPLLFCVIAVGAFAGSTWLERRIGKQLPASRTVQLRNRAAAVVLLVAAAGLILTPSTREPTEGAEDMVHSGLLAEVLAATDHVEPEVLAARLMAGSDVPLVVDIRDASTFDAFRIRGAVSVPLAELEARLGELPRGRAIVLYSNGTTHAAQAWLLLRQWGWTDVAVLTDGLLGFWRSCLTPPSLVAGDSRSARRAGAAFAARRAFFVDAWRDPLPVTVSATADALAAPGLVTSRVP